MHKKVTNVTKDAKDTNDFSFEPFSTFVPLQPLCALEVAKTTYYEQPNPHNTIILFLFLVLSFWLRLYFDRSYKRRYNIHPHPRIFFFGQCFAVCSAMIGKKFPYSRSFYCIQSCGVDSGSSHIARIFWQNTNNWNDSCFFSSLMCSQK